MINKIQLRGGNSASLKSSLKYIKKHQGDPKNGGESDSSIPQNPNSSDAEYAEVFNRKMEKTRQKGQKNLYAFASLSFTPNESKSMTDAQALEIAKDFYLNNAYPGNRHYYMTVENDKGHKHVHAIIGLTNLDTKKVNNKFVDFRPIADKIENKYGLEKVNRGANLEKPSPFSPASGTRKIEERTGKKTGKNILKESVANAFEGSSNFNDFLDNLKNQEVDFVPTTNKSGLVGASFEKDGEMFKGSQIGYSAAVLKKKFSKTKGYQQFLEFTDDTSKKIKNSFYDFDDTRPRDTNFKLGKNYVESGCDILHKNTGKKAYSKFGRQFVVYDNNFKTVNQAVEHFFAERPDATLNVPIGSESFRRKAWIVAKQQGRKMGDFYEPTRQDYESAIDKCSDEKQKDKLKLEMNEKMKNGELTKNGINKIKMRM